MLDFKGKLDKFLQRIPDQPTVPGGDGRAAESNSLVHQIGYISREDETFVSRWDAQPENLAAGGDGR